MPALPPADVDIAIVGGGIAGLAAAVACHRAGLSAHVFESAPAFAPLGTSLSIWPNAMGCLADWGLDKKVQTAGAPIASLAWRRPSGRAYFARSLDGLYTQAGHTGVCVRRAGLHAVLAGALPDGSVRLGHRLDAARTVPQGTQLSFERQGILTARQVIAADGLWSGLRAALTQDAPPRYAGYGAWLGQSPAPLPGDVPFEGCEYIGAGARMGVFETGGDMRYWFVVANTPDPTPHARPAHVDEVIPLLADWPAQFRELVAASPEPPVYVSFYDRPVARSWGPDGVTFVGDAMHPFVPNLGQGACQAIEDGHAIAHALSQGLRGAKLNRWMHRQRHARVAYMRRTANKVGQLAQSSSALVRGALSLFGMPPFSAMMTADLRRQFTRPGY